jgi:hypothetical protein
VGNFVNCFWRYFSCCWLYCCFVNQAVATIANQSLNLVMCLNLCTTLNTKKKPHIINSFLQSKQRAVLYGSIQISKEEPQLLQTYIFFLFFFYYSQ